MKPTLPLVAIVALFISTTCFAQIGSGSHPTDSTAVYKGTFQVTVPLSSFTGLRLDAAEGCEIIATITVWLTSTDRTDYVVNTGSIHFTGECGSVDAMTTEAIFGEVAYAAIIEGTSLGYSDCKDSSTQIENSRVYSNTCVQRSGQGTYTSFLACDAQQFCWRSYEVVCTSALGDPDVLLLPSDSGQCTLDLNSVCEPTCGAGAPLGTTSERQID